MPLIHWPGWKLLSHALLLGVALTAWWVAIFVGADWLTAQHGVRVRIHFDAELGIPFVPIFVLGYLSINPLFALAPFVLRSRAELHALTATLAAVTAVAGISFVLLPAEAAFPAPAEEGVFAPLLALAKGAALRHNMVPSLHVALSGVCVLGYQTHAGALGRCLLGAWLALIAGSTLLIHQHHVVDVVTGLALAWAGQRVVYDRWLRASRRTPPAEEQHA